MSDIDSLARFAYEQGTKPLDYAEMSVAALLGAHLMVRAAREDDPAAFPGYPIELSIGAAARRIIGMLLDAGWTPPHVPESDGAS